MVTKYQGFVWKRKKVAWKAWNNLSNNLSHIILMSFPLMILYRKLDLGPTQRYAYRVLQTIQIMCVGRAGRFGQY